MLQMLQSRAPGTWSLKMPSHAVHIEALLGSFPMSVWCGRTAILQVHGIVPPVELPLAVGARQLDVTEIVPNVLRQLEAHITRPLPSRSHRGQPFLRPALRRPDARPVGVMRSLYDWAGDDLTPPTEQAMLDWLNRTRSTVSVFSRILSTVRALQSPISNRFWRVPGEIRHRTGGCVRAAITTEQHGFDVVEVPDPTPGPDVAGHPGKRVRNLRI